MNIFILLISLFMLPTDCSHMPTVRAAYGNIDSEQKLLDFVKLVKSSECEKAIPYNASAEMQKAQFVLAPWTKYRHFLRGKKQLEAFIIEYPDNIEARYIRFLVQTHVPFFLGYNKQIKEDKEKIMKLLFSSNLSAEYKTQIQEHINKFKKQTK